MSDAELILKRARSLGLRLYREGDRLAIRPARLATPDVLAQLSCCKPQVLDLIEAEHHHLPRDCAPWLHVARQVMAGEFEGADASTVQSLVIGLRGIRHELGQRALKRLGCQRSGDIARQ